MDPISLLRRLFLLSLTAFILTPCRGQYERFVHKADFQNYYQNANYDESLVPEYELPDPLLCLDGTRVTSVEEWEEHRRPELVSLLESFMYGHAPAPDEGFRWEVIGTDPAFREGKAIRRDVVLHLTAEGPDIPLSIVVPNDGNSDKGHPVFFGLTFFHNDSIWTSRWALASWQPDTLLAHGYGLVTFCYTDACPDKASDMFGSSTLHHHFYAPGQTYPLPDQWAAVSCWAWTISRAMDWAGSFRTAAAEVQVLTKAQEAAITRRLNMLKAAQKKEEQMLAKEVAARKIAEAEKEKAINEGCVRIQMKYAETAARIEAEMRAAFRKISAEAQMSAAGQVQAIAATGTAAQAASTKMVAASTVAKGAVGSLTKTVWALVGGWYAVAAAIAFAFEKLVEFKQEKSKEITGDTYVGEQRYRKGADGAFYRQTINTEAEDAFDTYTETKVTDEEELAAVRAAYIQKHPSKKSSAAAPDTDKYKNLFSGGGDSGGGKGSSGKATDPLKEELEKRKKLQNSLEKEYAARMTIKAPSTGETVQKVVFSTTEANLAGSYELNLQTGEVGEEMLSGVKSLTLTPASSTAYDGDFEVWFRLAEVTLSGNFTVSVTTSPCTSSTTSAVRHPGSK